MDAQLVYILLSSLALILGLGITYWIHSQHQLQLTVSPAAPPEAGSAPPISIVIPARNEAGVIRRCVQAALEQAYPDFEVIVVDDRSTDATPRILAELAESNLRLKVIQGKDLPEGWAGKPYALNQGSEEARGEWLCFVDADTFLAPGALAASYRAAREHIADMFTMLTQQELVTFWEKVVLPVVFTGLSVGFPAERVNDPEKPDAIANGQYILIKRSVYRAVDGHRAVRARIDEDKALAEVVKRSGYRLILADGRAFADTRMYTSLAGMWEGWTKNIFFGMQDRLGLLSFGAFLGLVAALALPLWLVAGIAWVAADSGGPAWLVAGEALLLWVYLIWQRARAARAFQISAWYALSLPLGALVFTGMMFASAFKVLSGRGVTWKGRTYRGSS